MRSFLTVLFTFAIFFSNAQCLTDFSKLVPEPSVDAAVGFGNSVSMHDNYMAVGIPFNDSLGRATGIVYIYEFANGAWKRIAALAPSDPADAIRFGITVKLTQDYLLVGAQRNGGKVYLFKKPITGWSSAIEQTAFSYPVTSFFGIHSSRSLSISDDQQTIAISDPYYRLASMPLSRYGAIFIYHKNAADEWSGAIAPKVLLPPEDDCQDFGSSGASMQGNRLVTATPYAPTGVGRVYVYTDTQPGFQNPTLEASLDPGSSDPFNSYFTSFTTLAQTPEGIFVTGVTGLQSPNPTFGILFFEAPASGTWSNTSSATCYIEPKNSTPSYNRFPLHISSNGTDVFATVRDTNNKGYLSIIRKGPSGWCSPSYELIDESEPPSPPRSNNYGQVHAVNQTGTLAAIGFVAHPENPNSMVALKALNKNGTSWESQKLFYEKKTTAGHYYGSDILGFDDYLFVAAPYDGTVKPKAGAVYTYKKVANAWQKTGKILPPLGQSAYDDVFGSALASNKTYLAIGAAGHEPKGKIFMYKKTSNDWSSVELVQEITIPEEGLTVYAYGDNLAMDDDWLVVPYVQNSPARVILAIFKFNGTTWDFKQIAEVGMASIFAKSSTLDVAIENGVLVAGSQILELNSSGVWEAKYTLSPSDPEPMQMAPDFSHWITNGSLFGHSVAIHDNTIFIGAPQRDYNDTWDVGAVYVYTKQPNESWSSRTESMKLVPRVKEERELFGYSLAALYNTLIVGAPGSDYKKDNVTPRNKPGRAYVFQAEDYQWTSVTPLIDFTGESFEKDYYGISVFLDETDFFIGATIEDIENAKLSGAVYITPTPPIVKLVPPVCGSAGSLIDLFGYPFGGTWSGPGIVDAAEGTFDPIASGTGVHTFTYKTESCAYPGKLRIRVEPPVSAILETNTTVPVCFSQSFSKTLTVKSQNNCQYQWYYKSPASSTFTAMVGKVNPSVNVTQRGEYQVKVYNHVCSAFSPVITVKDEVVDLQLTPIGPICNNRTDAIPLIATPAGGVWSGSGVSNDAFVAANLPSGNKVLTYKYTSSSGCIFQNTMAVQVTTRFEATIVKQSGDLCENGSVTLIARGAPANPIFIWMEKSEAGVYETMNENSNTLTIDHNGSYQLKVIAGPCQSLTVPFILDQGLALEMTPAVHELEVCSDDIVRFEFEDQPGNQYDWYFTSNADDQPEKISATTNYLDVNKTGYYKGIVTRGVCVFESDVKFLSVLPADSIFIPNVFTPNGDNKNEIFQAITNLDNASMYIFNRHGKEIYSGSALKGWCGSNESTGVYYWNVSYSDCHNRRKNLKGWVQLVR